jgi:hypothetical protein
VVTTLDVKLPVFTASRHGTSPGLNTSYKPSPAREVTLPPVCGRLTKGPNPAEVNRCRILKSGGVTMVAVGVDELDAVGQIAGLYR